MECDNAKAVISVGCCYNLLSEEASDMVDSCCGFPVSQGVKSAGVVLDKNARDLACQVDGYYTILCCLILIDLVSIHSSLSLHLLSCLPFHYNCILTLSRFIRVLIDGEAWMSTQDFTTLSCMHSVLLSRWYMLFIWSTIPIGFFGLIYKPLQ